MNLNIVGRFNIKFLNNYSKHIPSIEDALNYNLGVCIGLINELMEALLKKIIIKIKLHF